LLALIAGTSTEMIGAPTNLVVRASDRPAHCWTFCPALVFWMTSPICQSRRASVS
jgi:hypothetical protein